MKFAKKFWQIIKRPYFSVTALLYFVAMFGLKVVLGLNLLNIFTVGLIPLVAIAIYLTWNLFYDENIDDEMSDTRIEKIYFASVSRFDRKKLKEFMRLREDIQKLIGKAHLNPSKGMLLTEFKQFDINELIEKYAVNCTRIKFITDFLHKKGSAIDDIKDTVLKLEKAAKRYHKLNSEIKKTLDAIEAHSVLLLADDISSNYTSKESINDILKKIDLLDRSNKEINEFYGSIHQGETNGIKD